jgi:ribosomal protein L11 methyltransferase
MDAVQEHLREMVENAEEPQTANELAATLSKTTGFSRKSVFTAIRNLVNSGLFAYEDRHGRTVITPSFNQPVKISERIILSPPDIPCEDPENGIIIRLLHGASFGNGGHPTTRLSLQGIDYALNQAYLKEKHTGSGVRAISALLLGMDRGLGLDIDPCAIHEAKENVRINGLDKRLEISDAVLENIGGEYSLITANLRLPSLNRVASQVFRLAAEECVLVISGIHSEELPQIVHVYGLDGFRLCWHKEEKGWTAAVFVRLSGRHVLFAV